MDHGPPEQIPKAPLPLGCQAIGGPPETPSCRHEANGGDRLLAAQQFFVRLGPTRHSRALVVLWGRSSTASRKPRSPRPDPVGLPGARLAFSRRVTSSSQLFTSAWARAITFAMLAVVQAGLKAELRLMNDIVTSADPCT